MGDNTGYGRIRILIFYFFLTGLALLVAVSCTRGDGKKDREEGETEPTLVLQWQKGYCDRCHPAQVAAFEARYLHPPFQQGACLACHQQHNMNPAEVSLRSPGGGCTTCHGQARPLPVQHQPYARQSCTSCHDPHSSDTSGLLKAGGRELCLSCHAQKLGVAPEGKAVAGKESCLSCHAPHQSENPRLLKTAPGALCLQCHAGVSAGATFPHRPVKEGSCLACHGPHSQKPKLLEEGSNVACLRCHGATLQQGPGGQPAPACGRRELHYLPCPAW